MFLFFRHNHQGGVKFTKNLSFVWHFHMPYNVSILNCMYIILKITFVMIVIYQVCYGV